MNNGKIQVILKKYKIFTKIKYIILFFILSSFFSFTIFGIDTQQIKFEKKENFSQQLELIEFQIIELKKEIGTELKKIRQILKKV